MSDLRSRFASIVFTFAMVATLLAVPQAPPAQAISPDIVISQVYGGGGNSGAVYTHDFIELFNRGTSSVSLAGWSVQYASATGTGN
ncbi:MAG: lamin tail domain-containing protein, partial [Actinobacteria bacterium]